MIKRIVIASLFCMATTAAASDSNQDFTTVTLDDLKAKCAEFAANDQMRPVSATISCSELRYEWQPQASEPAQLNNTRNVGATVRMKSMQVPLKLFDARINPTQIQCQGWVKVEHKVEGLDVEVACAELEKIDDLGSYCEPIIADRVADDPALQVSRNTTEVVTACPASAVEKP